MSGNLLNLNAEGVLSLTTNGKSYVDYKVEVLADLDILSLIKGADEDTRRGEDLVAVNACVLDLGQSVYHIKIAEIGIEHAHGSYRQGKTVHGKLLVGIAEDSADGICGAFIKTKRGKQSAQIYVELSNVAVARGEGNVAQHFANNIRNIVAGSQSRGLRFSLCGEVNGTCEQAGNVRGYRNISRYSHIIKSGKTANTDRIFVNIARRTRA